MQIKVFTLSKWVNKKGNYSSIYLFAAEVNNENKKKTRKR